MKTYCPNCGCSWGFDELQFQECDLCGYPDHDNCSECIGECTCEDYDDEYDYEDYDPNDSRNL